MFPDRRTKPWLRTPGLIIVAVVYVLGVVVTALATWATFKYVAPPSRLIEAAFVAVVLIIVGVLLIRTRRSEPGSKGCATCANCVGRRDRRGRCG